MWVDLCVRLDVVGVVLVTCFSLTTHLHREQHLLDGECGAPLALRVVVDDVEADLAWWYSYILVVSIQPLTWWARGTSLLHALNLLDSC